MNANKSRQGTSEQHGFSELNLASKDLGKPKFSAANLVYP